MDYFKAIDLTKTELYNRVKELETAAAELLEYAKENQPHGECASWLGEHPIDVMKKLLKRGN